MSDMKLFRTNCASLTELRGSAFALEKSLHTLIERNMEAFPQHAVSYIRVSVDEGVRMDSLGIDLLMDYSRDFEWLVLEHFRAEQAKAVDWRAPRLACIAGDFTKYDAHRKQKHAA